MSNKIKATVSQSLTGDWEGTFEGTSFQICEGMAEELLGLDPNHAYEITVKDKKPKKWRTSLLLESEPTHHGNVLFVSKRHLYEPIEGGLAIVLYDNFFFGKNNRCKIWVKVKKIDE